MVRAAGPRAHLPFGAFFNTINLMVVLRQSLVIISSTVLVFIWQRSEFANFTIQAVGFLIFLYLLAAAKNKWRVSIGGEIGIFVLNSIILLLIFQTGGLISPLFFLLFFILFGVAVVLEPKIVFVLVISWLFLFAPFVSDGGALPNLLRVGSLALVSPLSYLFGKIYNKQEKTQQNVSDIKERTRDAADTISQDVEEVLDKDKDKIEEKGVEKLNEILEETEGLREESKDKNS